MVLHTCYIAVLYACALHERVCSTHNPYPSPFSQTYVQLWCHISFQLLTDEGTLLMTKLSHQGFLEGEMTHNYAVLNWDVTPCTEHKHSQWLCQYNVGTVSSSIFLFVKGYCNSL